MNEFLIYFMRKRRYFEMLRRKSIDKRVSILDTLKSTQNTKAMNSV